MKFKVGDKITINQNIDPYRKGDSFKITEVHSDWILGTSLKNIDDTFEWCFTEDEVNPSNSQIIKERLGVK